MSELVYTRTCVALPTQYDIGEVGSLRAWYFLWRHGSWQLHAYPLNQESWANPLATGTSEADAEMDLSEVRRIVEGVLWVLDHIVDGDAFAYAYATAELGPADVLVLPAPSGPVEKRSWGWECGNVEADDLADADAWAAELPQHIADSRAIAAHIRALPVAEEGK